MSKPDTTHRHNGADAHGNLICVACDQPRRAGHYMCGSCWRALPAAARAALNKKDNLALERLRELLDQLRDGRTLAEIQVTP